MKRLIVTTNALCLLVFSAACDESNDEESEPARSTETTNGDGSAEVVFYGVGQGDSTLLRDEETTILIDTGRHDDERIVTYLQEDEVRDIDLLVLTHPHADHIGNADVILDEYDVAEVWMSGEEHTTATYERVIDAILSSEAHYEEPRAGDDAVVGGFQIEVVGPYELTGNLNDGSLAMRITYDEVSILFTGDAEEAAEARIMERPERLNADLFHVGHHGSSTSNTSAFLDAIDPDAAVYSAGQDNEYGHPHDDVVSRFYDLGIEWFGTDQNGEVYVVIEEGEWDLYTER